MGSICKCPTLDSKTCQSEVTFTSKNMMSQGQEKFNNQFVSPFQDQRFRTFYIIYPKNENDLVQLLEQLQVLNQDQLFEIEEYYQQSQENERNEVNSHFNLNCISDGSFNYIHLTSNQEKK
ncbi:unnamed protein product [Paramecium sonneborni]|uniref:Uncharacterized protein n=1 Tax=Paramecium sonneborni TaxID=65129 RepID=A0A8S1NDA3_9CILI|nr:unnamed protein product [Paramecium sonneborni]